MNQSNPCHRWSPSQVLCLGGCDTEFVETALPATPFSGVTVLPYWDDLCIDADTSQGIYYGTQGTAPNRTLIVDYYQFQVLFFEAQPKKVPFKYYVASDRGASCTVGVQGNYYRAVQ